MSESCMSDSDISCAGDFLDIVEYVLRTAYVGCALCQIGPSQHAKDRTPKAKRWVRVFVKIRICLCHNMCSNTSQKRSGSTSALLPQLMCST